MLDPIKTVVNPYNERPPDRRNSRQDRRKRLLSEIPAHHLQQEPTGERIDLTA